MWVVYLAEFEICHPNWVAIAFTDFLSPAWDDMGWLNKQIRIFFGAQSPEDGDLSGLCFSHATQDGNFSKSRSSIQRKLLHHLWVLPIFISQAITSTQYQQFPFLTFAYICHQESSICIQQNINTCQQDPRVKYIYICLYIYIFLYIHTHIDTYTHMYMYIYIIWFNMI